MDPLHNTNRTPSPEHVPSPTTPKTLPDLNVDLSSVIELPPSPSLTVSSAMPLHSPLTDCPVSNIIFNNEISDIDFNPSNSAISEYIVEFCELIREITLPEPIQYSNLFSHVSWTHQEVSRMMMFALKANGVGIEEVEQFIQGINSKPGQIYFYSNLAKTLHLLGEVDKAKEICTKFVQLSKNHKRCLYEISQKKTLVIEIDFGSLQNAPLPVNRPSFIDIVYGILIIPELSPEHVTELVALVNHNILKLEDEISRIKKESPKHIKKEIIKSNFLPEEYLILSALLYRGYEIIEPLNRRYTDFLDTKDFGKLFFDFLEKYPEREIVIAVLNLIDLAAEPLSTLKNIIKLRCLHLYEPSIRDQFIELAKKHGLFGCGGHQRDPKACSKLVSSEESLILQTKYGNLDLSSLRFNDGEYESGDEEKEQQLETFTEIHQCLAYLEDPEVLLGNIQEIVHEIKTNDIDEIIYSIFSGDRSGCTDYLYTIIHQKLLDLGYQNPSCLVTKEVLEDCLKGLPSSYRIALDKHFPSNDLIQRHRQVKVASWIKAQTNLEDPQVIQTLEDSISPVEDSDLDSRDKSDLFKDILLVLKECKNTKKRKAESQITPEDPKHHE